MWPLLQIFFLRYPLLVSYIVEWFWGGFYVDNATLNRFFALHYLLPFLIAGLAVVHLSLLHTAGSGNPLGINTNIDSITFYPYFYSKDVFAFLTYVFFLCFFLRLVTPPQVVLPAGRSMSDGSKYCKYDNSVSGKYF